MRIRARRSGAASDSTSIERLSRSGSHPCSLSRPLPSERTEITEIVTGLAMLSYPTAEMAVLARPTTVTNVRDDQWERLAELLEVDAHRQTFAAAWANGLAFAKARDGLRGRAPMLVEWKGPHGSVGDQVAPIDLRIDHVYQVSCKYLSRILLNVAPASLFERGLLGPHSRSRLDWYQQTAPSEYQALYDVVRDALSSSLDLPRAVDQLSVGQRRALKERLRNGWTGAAQDAYAELAAAVSAVSATRWRTLLASRREQEAMLWRLLRIGSAPYFVLGANTHTSIRLRIATPWDWRQHYELRGFDVWADTAGQPLVRWKAHVNTRGTRTDQEIDGHIEIRWSHGRFAQPPEAKVYLDTAHAMVPGYAPLV